MSLWQQLLGRRPRPGARQPRARRPMFRRVVPEFEALEDRRLPANLSVSDVTVTEGAPAVFTVSLSEPVDVSVSFDFMLVDNTAHYGSDYYLTGFLITPVVIPPGQTGATV